MRCSSILLSLCCPLPKSPRLVTTFPLGLTAMGATEQHYTASLSLLRPLLLRGSIDFMAAARQDAIARLPQGAGAEDVEASTAVHLVEAAARCSRFIQSDTVHGREETRDALVHCFRQQGQLCLLLGGKSVGKSLLLSQLARRRDIVGENGVKRALLYVDARVFGADLSAGLYEVLKEDEQEVVRSGLLRGEWRAQVQRPLRGARAQKGAAGTLGGSILGLQLQGKFALDSPELPLTAAQLNMKTLPLVVDALKSKGMYPCLIIDEANLALPMPPAPGATPSQRSITAEEERKLTDTRQLLDRLVQLTKQTNSMNLLLVSSEYAYPYRLRASNFFATSNLTDVFIASEVSPAKMRALLRDAWGLGPRLSDVFLAFFGGHVHMASRALSKLSAQRDAFRVEEVAPAGAKESIARFLEESAMGIGAMASVLQALAVRGFAPCAHEGDTCAQELSLANLGGLVTDSSTVLGMSKAVRSSSGCGLVPSSHFLRHLVAQVLHERLKGSGEGVRDGGQSAVPK
jgi:hypothetical protein